MAKNIRQSKQAKGQSKAEAKPKATQREAEGAYQKPAIKDLGNLRTMMIAMT